MSTTDGEPLAGPGRRPRPEGFDARRTALLVAAVVLAGAAVVAVVVADDARWLRLGVVAALWTALLAVFLLSRRAPARAEERADDRLEALRRRHERELSEEAAVREDEVAAARREAESGRQDEISALREEVERLRSHAEAVTVQPLEVRPARLRVVGEGAPPPRRTAAHHSAPYPPADRPHHLRPAPVVGPAAVPPPSAVPPAAFRPAHPEPLRPEPSRPAPARQDPAVAATGSFVDQYVRTTSRAAPADPPARGARDAAPDRGPSATTGRTVAELLAAHAAAGGTGGRRRRDER